MSVCCFIYNKKISLAIVIDFLVRIKLNILFYNIILLSLSRKCIKNVNTLWWAFLKLKWAGLLPVVLGPSILSKRVKTSPTATQFDSACAQTMSRLPGARLRRVERGVYPLFLPQK